MYCLNFLKCFNEWNRVGYNLSKKINLGTKISLFFHMGKKFKCKQLTQKPSKIPKNLKTFSCHVNIGIQKPSQCIFLTQASSNSVIPETSKHS